MSKKKEQHKHKSIPRKIFISTLLILSAGSTCFAQDKNNGTDINFSVFAAPSKVLDALSIYNNLLETSRYVGFGTQVGFQKRPDSMDWYEKAYNNPEFGFGLWYQPLSSSLQFKNDSRLGSMVNIYGYGNWDFLNSDRLSLRVS